MPDGAVGGIPLPGPPQGGGGGGGGAGPLTTEPLQAGSQPYINPAIYDDLSLYNQEDSESVITDFEIHHHYERDLHLYMMGIASPQGFQGNRAAFVQLASPTLMWIADWTGARFLEKPMVPDPISVSSEWVLMDVWMNPAQIVIGQDGTTPLFRLTGTYIFGHQNPGPNFYSNVSFPVAPWFTSTGFVSLRSINAGDLDKTGLLEPSTIAGGLLGGVGNLGPGVAQGQ